MIESKSISKKIKALFEKAESAQKINSIEEAETFFAKANELLMKHNLSLDDLVFEGKTIKEDITYTAHNERIAFYKNKSLGYWEVDLIDVLAKANFCKALFHNVNSGYSTTASIFGTTSNIEVVKYLFDTSNAIFPYLAVQAYNKLVTDFRTEFEVIGETAMDGYITLMAKVTKQILACDEVIKSSRVPIKTLVLRRKHLMEVAQLEVEDLMPKPYTKGIWYIKSLNKVSYLVPDRGVFIRSFLSGVSIGLEAKFKEQLDTYEKENEQKNQNPQVETGMAVIASIKNLVKIKNQEVTAFMKSKFPNTRSMGNTSNSSSNAGLSAGINAGKNTNFSRGINDSSSKLLN